MINLLPLDSKKNLRRRYVSRLLTVGLFAGSGLLVLAYILLIPSFFLTRSKETLVLRERELLDAGEQNGSFEELRSTVSEVNARLDVMQTQPSSLLSDALLDELLITKTADIGFRSIAYTQRTDESPQFELRGVARSREALVAFIERIEAHEGFVILQAPVSNFVDARDLAFMLQVALNQSDNTSEL